MKKHVILADGSTIHTECDLDFLNKYRGLAIDVFTTYIPGIQLTEDDKQDLDVVIFEAFSTYNEQSRFSTWLTWKLKGYCSSRVARATAAKRDSSNFKILNLEYTMQSKCGGAETKIHDVVEDHKIRIEEDFIDSELIKYISSHLNELELKLLAVNLKKIKAIELAHELGTSRQNVNNLNKKLKKRLAILIDEFNK